MVSQRAQHSGLCEDVQRTAHTIGVPEPLCCVFRPPPSDHLWCCWAVQAITNLQFLGHLPVSGHLIAAASACTTTSHHTHPDATHLHWRSCLPCIDVEQGVSKVAQLLCGLVAVTPKAKGVLEHVILHSNKGSGTEPSKVLMHISLRRNCMQVLYAGSVIPMQGSVAVAPQLQGLGCGQAQRLQFLTCCQHTVTSLETFCTGRHWTALKQL